MSTGPFLYDEGPAPLHTGTPRSRQGWLVGGLIAVFVLAAAMVGGILLVKGSPDEQATEVAGVFLAALADDDSETAHGLLCEEERARLQPDEVAREYLGAGSGEITGARRHPVEGDRQQLVQVSWDDGGTSSFTVIGEDGPRICGVD